jgi:two-component system, chemotaxis family, protein-glutamate methylesterase/glutaminase
LRHNFYACTPNAITMDRKPNYVVVAGASAGGFTALVELVSQLNPNSDAAYFIVLHLSAKSISGFLASKLQEHTTLKCVLAMDGMPIQKGYIYVAMPNHHLTMNKDEVRLGNGPTENRWRPSIDVLFRAAAAHFTSRAIGIVLTGLLNDGTAGMSAIKRCGGTTIVQDPNEAEYPDMPFSVLNAMEVDHVVSVTEMGGLITELTKVPPPEPTEPPKDVRMDTELMEKMITRISTSEEYGRHTVYTCPDCGGVLFEHDDDAIVKFKCHTGHSYTVRDLIKKQAEETEDSLWYAIRSLEQRRALLDTLAERYSHKGNRFLATDYQKKVEEIESHIENLKKVIVANLDEPSEM